MMPPLAVTVPAAAAIVATALVLPHAAASPASVGAGIQVAPVSVAVVPGTASHARVTVMNTGSGTETLAVRADRPVPASWVHGGTVTLAPGAEGTAQVTVTVPAGTAPGRYRGYLEAGASPGTAAGLNFGAAALADLVITVTPSGTSRHDTPRNAHPTSTATGA